MANLSETSMNFDLDGLLPFLVGLKTLIDSGFSDEEISGVQRTAAEMHIDEEKTLQFSIVFKGEPTILRIHLFMDDIESPDVTFFTHPILVKKIDSLRH